MKNIHEDRVHHVQEQESESEGKYVLYWMALSNRSHWNYGLEYAVGLAEEHDCSVLTLVNIEKQQKHFTERHLRFMLEGVRELNSELRDRDIQLVLRQENIKDSIRDLEGNAVHIVTDFPYLKEDRERLSDCTSATSLPVTAIEGNVVVPVEAASDKQEYAARTIRGDIMDIYKDYLTKPTSSSVHKSSLNYDIDSLDVRQIDQIIDDTQFSEHTELIDRDYKGGFSGAKAQLNTFLRNQLEEYDDSRQSPTEPAVSHLSAFLARGMIAPAYIVSRLQNQSGNQDDQDSFIEELVVRRGLAHNFVYFADDYDKFSALPEWARETLNDHKDDEREYSYTRDEFEQGKTEDEPWNESMRRIRETGYLHNHMRMYWGKQVLAWSNTPQYALKTLLYLNNKYFLDGNDPNSYANCLWVFGLHDRAWGENDVFGKVRKMNRNGLENKIDVEEFVNVGS